MELSKNSLLWRFLCLSMNTFDQWYYKERGMIDGCTLVAYFFKSVFVVLSIVFICVAVAGCVYMLSILLYSCESGVALESLFALTWWQQILVVLYGVCIFISIVILVMFTIQVGYWIVKLLKFKTRPSVLVQSFKAKRRSFCLSIKIK